MENSLKPLTPQDLCMIRRENVAKKTRFSDIALRGVFSNRKFGTHKSFKIKSASLTDRRR
jgi:hypothetical protein